MQVDLSRMTRTLRAMVAGTAVAHRRFLSWLLIIATSSISARAICWLPCFSSHCWALSAAHLWAFSGTLALGTLAFWVHWLWDYLLSRTCITVNKDLYHNTLQLSQTCCTHSLVTAVNAFTELYMGVSHICGFIHYKVCIAKPIGIVPILLCKV